MYLHSTIHILKQSVNLLNKISNAEVIFLFCEYMRYFLSDQSCLLCILDCFCHTKEIIFPLNYSHDIACATVGYFSSRIKNFVKQRIIITFILRM